ncbi:MAG: peptide chain release factor aRF-1 [Candidatus Nitrosocosmicus sp.]|jgi:peptide chain release factor subunit 1|uniref:peptide chain release factor aRF-1 n=1 Tax=Candidatus Nitrosocosmicus agrestis TaxID=2563600 RepID=UPI00122E09DE|nr:peptide chain release factor aRF-1 [Candidatus Nitrosocosmicus sp. SS]KAA2282643.1 peptide chain release factor 1 [Candidatus Nitrosocosmicus sp. SS]KAF0867900.1 peptide chain release factor 1 [Candidatus Nitrosocosmicus sp. SS]MDR4491120.1 peptide chain release factor aRF-1 [Candidatus Nitrosocosmicus sp.]HET6590657.1 peptide chain release factor aRF-1 [Candidatus Nitrosocosmicus sp.]
MPQASGEEKWDSVKKYKLTKMLNDLSKISGHGTELVSVYIPPKRPIHDVLGQLRNEAGTATNIKSDLTRNHVQDALNKTMEQLKLYKEPPENGLVIFCGAIPTGKGIGTEKIEIYTIVPPKPVQINLYRCDDHFWIDHIKEMLKDDRTIAIISIDTQEAGLGILTGDRWETVETLTSGVSGKHRQGGQSARRFERLRDNELNEYYHRVADYAQKIFIDQYTVKGLIVGGPGPTKDTFLREEYLDYRLQNNVIATLDTSYSGDEGVREIIEKVNDQGIMTEFRSLEEKKIVKKFMSEIFSGKGLGVYGLNDVVNYLKSGITDSIIVTDNVDLVFLEVACNKCNNKFERIVERDQLVDLKQSILSTPCKNCNGIDFSINEKDFIDFLEEYASLSGTKLDIISSKTEEGAQIESLGKIGALLRFKPMS